MFFQGIPSDYESMRKNIDFKHFHKVYSKFTTYLFLPYSKIIKNITNQNNCILNQDDNPIKDFLFNYLKDYKFIVCDIIPSDNNKNDIKSHRTSDIIICVENKCIIIEEIDNSMINNILLDLKNIKISIINVGISTNEFKQENDAKEEVFNFCQKYREQINSNKFVKKTIKAIACYLIRRFFYPTNYFNDSSFFDISFINDEIEQSNNKKKEKVRSFSKSDFIILRAIYSNEYAHFQLAFHLESLHIFMLKQIFERDKYESKIQHEINFCQNFSHYCFTPFYGFLKNGKNGMITGFVYEYMVNDNLNLKSNLSKIDEVFSLMTIFRLSQGIKYLQSNNLVHRDIKPLNILINHDFIPYISDFDTIRPFDDQDINEMTVDIGSLLYSAPELSVENGILTKSTDVYSLGLIIYYLFEKNDDGIKSIFLYKSDANYEYPQMKHGSDKIKKLYKQCIKFDPKDRIDIDKCIKIILKELCLYIKDNKITNDSINKKYSTLLFTLGTRYERGIGIKQSYSKARMYYEMSANLNNSDALFYLGYYCEKGYNCEQSYSTAKKYYKLSAKLNNHKAFNQLGYLYENGFGVKQDFLKAKEYYELSAKQNNYNALYNLGSLYEYGLGVGQSYSKAKEYYELSAKQNNHNAIFALGYLYENGFGVEQSYSKAKEYYELSAKLNNSDALNRLGYFYEVGLCIEQSYLKAKEYYELSAELNNSDAFYSLGYLYENGYGVPLDFPTAIKYYKSAVEQNNPNGLNRLGYLYENGFGVEQDYTKARNYYELAAKYDNSNALCNLGFLYYDGKGVERSYSKAKEYFELAANLNNSDAVFMLGRLYEKGDGVEQNYSLAIEYYEKSAKQDNWRAFQNLGNLYLHGYGTMKNIEKANLYFKLSCKYNNSLFLLELGDRYVNGYDIIRNYYLALKTYEKLELINNSDAMYRIGDLYCNGQGVEKDCLKANEYYEKSAKLGNSIALIKSGNLYFNGIGVDKDIEKAIKYYELSAQLGNPEASFIIGDIYRKGENIKQDYMKSLQYIESSANNNYPASNHFLGELYSNGDFFEVDIPKSIKYFEKSIEINDYICRMYNNVDHYYTFSNLTNKCHYYSYNDLGLIYLINLKDVEKATEYIKKAACAEYPFGQNNLGLLYEFYFNSSIRIDDIKHFYQKSSKNKFALAYFNFARLNIKKGNNIKSIECYKNALENENSALIYHDYSYYDKRLQISTMFILCLTNLKLSKHYFTESIDESREYFIKVFSKLKTHNNNNINHMFRFVINTKTPQNIFVCLLKFILNYPAFNLINQINTKEWMQKIIDSIDPNFIDYMNGAAINNGDNSINDLNNTQQKENACLVNEFKFKQTENLMEMMKHEKYEISKEMKKEEDIKSIGIQINDEKVFENEDDIFEFIIKNKKCKNIFNDEIEKIIQILEEIIYTPPYPILFGRINIEKPNEKINNAQKNINEEFYEGFGYIP